MAGQRRVPCRTPRHAVARLMPARPRPRPRPRPAPAHLLRALESLALERQQALLLVQRRQVGPRRVKGGVVLQRIAAGIARHSTAAAQATRELCRRSPSPGLAATPQVRTHARMLAATPQLPARPPEPSPARPPPCTPPDAKQRPAPTGSVTACRNKCRTRRECCASGGGPKGSGGWPPAGLTGGRQCDQRPPRGCLRCPCRRSMWEAGAGPAATQTAALMATTDQAGEGWH